MIKQIKAYQVSDGSTAATLEEAQTRELALLFAGEGERFQNNVDLTQHIAAIICDKRERIVDILTTGPNSRPARRKINGGTTKRRKASAVATEASAA